MIAEPSSLEDWVAVKLTPFRNQDQSKPAGRFLVSWNSELKEFSVVFNEKSRAKSDQMCHNYSTMLSVEKIREIHAQLAHLCPDLELYLPLRPSRTIWDYVWPESMDYDVVAEQLQVYFSFAYEKCTYLTTMSTFFPEDFQYCRNYKIKRIFYQIKRNCKFLSKIKVIRG